MSPRMAARLAWALAAVTFSGAIATETMQPANVTLWLRAPEAGR